MSEWVPVAVIEKDTRIKNIPIFVLAGKGITDDSSRAFEVETGGYIGRASDLGSQDK
ncbi:MAG: hypothetical protein JW715_04640 [Sedimentisphaerales bacterium]|nr:hypothetical protein [Sedimentisphaerales bacterium]